ncbi:MAG: hypothetical protein D6696_12545 [Acidobacteria bacterium]|nr:MAG: hypothetical protein D6696_12545 [Acidobacteriota bacterium]
MKQKTRNVLVVGVSPEEFTRVAPFLERSSFDVDRFPSASGAIELISQVPFEVLIVRFPLPDMELEDFLDAVRRDGSPCLRSPLLLLSASAGDREEAERYVGRGANRVLPLEETERAIQREVSALLQVAPRKAARFVAKLEIKLGGAKDMIICQTENISASGMLIKTDRRYDKGTQIAVEFTIGDDPRPIQALAEVVRHTMIGRDQVGGIGVRFLSFTGDSQRRFNAYLEQL